jgi:hypothetical protein
MAGALGGHLVSRGGSRGVLSRTLSCGFIDLFLLVSRLAVLISVQLKLVRVYDLLSS